MPKNSLEKAYEEAVSIAKLISAEMTWLYANYQVFQTGGEEEILEKMTNTYSGHIWKLIRRGNLNEIHLTLCKIIDKDDKTASLFTLKNKLDQKGILALLEKKYSQGEGTFKRRLTNFKNAVADLDKYMKDHKSSVRKLLRHRHNYLAHRKTRPYGGEDNLQVGDEKELIEAVSKAVEPMEHLLLNAGNVSHSINSSYKLYSKKFWAALSPEKEKDSF